MSSSKKEGGGSQPNAPENNKKQVSEPKRDANRGNSQKSTGPTSTEGRRWSSRNSLKHGLRAKALLIAGTGNSWSEQVNQLLTELRDYYEPETLEQEIWVQRLAIECWRQQRALECETRQVDRQPQVFFYPEMGNLLRYEAATNRNLAQALKEIERLKKEQSDSAAEPDSVERSGEPPASEAGDTAAD